MQSCLLRLRLLAFSTRRVLFACGGGACRVVFGVLGLVAVASLGALVFSALEQPNDVHARDAFCDFMVRVKGNLSAELYAELTGSYLPTDMCGSDWVSLWSFGDGQHAYFFAFEILSTIGYGEIAPQTSSGRAFTLLFALLSIPLAGIIFSMIASRILSFIETWTLMCRPDLLTAFCKFDKDRSFLLDEFEFTEALADVGVSSKSHPNVTFAIEKVRESSAGAKLGLAQFAEIISVVGTHDQRRRRRMVRLCAMILVAIIWILLGGAMFSAVEGWSFLDSVYFCIITLTTVGLGDFVPQTKDGEALHFFYCTFGLGIFATVITAASDALQLPIARSQASVEEVLLERLSSDCALTEDLAEELAKTVSQESDSLPDEEVLAERMSSDSSFDKDMVEDVASTEVGPLRDCAQSRNVGNVLCTVSVDTDGSFAI